MPLFPEQFGLIRRRRNPFPDTKCKKGMLQNSLTKKYAKNRSPRKAVNRFSGRPIFIACFSFLVQLALALSFCNSPLNSSAR